VRARTRFARILTECASGDDRTLRTVVAGADLDGLAELAFEHRVAPLVFARLRNLDDVDPKAVQRLATFNLANRAGTARVLADLAYLADLLAPLEVPWVVVKGPAAAVTLYDPPDTRAAGDLDVLLSPADFEEVVTQLGRAGHPIEDANWELIRRQLAGQVHLRLPSGTHLDLHWSLLFNGSDRLTFPISTDELLERRRTVQYGAVRFATLDPADTLVHLCFHAADGGGDRLAWLADIHRAATRGSPDWDAVKTRTRSWRMQLPVGTLLLRARDQLGTPVPDDVLDHLLPRAWRTGMRTLDHIFPAARSTRRSGNPASLLARSAAVTGSPRAALGAAARGLTRRGRQLLAERTAERAERVRPNDLHVEAGDANDRSSYFAAVADFADREPRLE